MRFRFAGRGPLLVAMLVAYTIPSVVLLVPLLVIFRTYGLNNTLPGLILAEATHTAPFVLLLMINYFSTLPRELEEAAQVDGCGRLQTLCRIVLPLSVPGLVAGGLFAFIMTWNNFLFAFLFTTTEAIKTLPVIMRLFALGRAGGLGHQRGGRDAHHAAGGAALPLVPANADERAGRRRGEGLTFEDRRSRSTSDSLNVDPTQRRKSDEAIPDAIVCADERLAACPAARRSRTIGVAGVAAGGALTARRSRSRRRRPCAGR